MPHPPSKPATSRLSLFAASLAAPLAFLATLAIALLLLTLGAIKLLPVGTIDAPSNVVAGVGGADLMRLATGGIIDSPWGGYLVGVVQILLGIGLLVPAARAVAGLGCLLTAIGIAIGLVCHWPAVSTAAGLNATGVSLVFLFTLLLAGAAFGARGAARRLGAAN